MTLNHLCRTKYLTSVIFALLLLPFIFSNNVSAVSDFTQVVTQPSNPVLSNCDINCYNQYHYMILEWTPTSTNNFITLNASFTYDGTTRSNSFYFGAMSGYAILDIQYLSSVFNTDGTWPNIPVTITLTENLPGESAPCPDPEPCNCDIPPIVQFFKETFFNIVLGIIPAFGIFAVVWFMVDLLSSLWFGRGK